MWILLGFIFALIGFLVGTLGIAQIFTIIRVAIPMSISLKKDFNNKSFVPLYLQFLYTILLWLIIIGIITFLVYTKTHQIGEYLTGFLFAAIITIPHTNATPENIEEFYKAYSRFFNT